uniref:Uncharacterized protein n=1 Tax=Entomoneis paludosa TaxID=265537 RepID=A0A7S2YGG3_9STRA|mmetsp:Transcript_32090/g.66977  ORF Transcript_32090/g.66977 Transcript_32090/m.66977 type:complete len:262 (+) Transcript_32090:24-809(+)
MTSKSSCLSSTNTSIARIDTHPDDVSTNQDIEGSTSPTKQKRKVSFDEDPPSVQLIPYLGCMSVFEISSIWYLAEDYEIMREEQSRTIRTVSKSSSTFEETDEQSFRGLEAKTKGGTLVRDSMRRRSIECVLEQQEMQGHRNESKIECIAQIYRKESLQSLAEARELALEDQRCAKTYLASNKEKDAQQLKKIAKQWSRRRMGSFGKIKTFFSAGKVSAPPGSSSPRSLRRGMLRWSSSRTHIAEVVSSPDCSRTLVSGVA